MFVPKSVDRIGKDAFDGCSQMDTVITDRRDPIPTVYVDENGQEQINSWGFIGRYGLYSVLMVPADCREKYFSTDGAWGANYGDQVVGLPVKYGDLYYDFKHYTLVYDKGEQDFYEAIVAAETDDANNYASLRGTVTIPNVISSEGIEWKVTTIGRGAFRNAPIAAVEMSQNLKTVEAEAFMNATRLTSISLPSGTVPVNLPAVAPAVLSSSVKGTKASPHHTPTTSPDSQTNLPTSLPVVTFVAVFSRAAVMVTILPLTGS